MFRTIRTGSRRSTWSSVSSSPLNAGPPPCSNSMMRSAARPAALKSRGFSGQAGSFAAADSVLVVGLGEVLGHDGFHSGRRAHVRSELERRGDTAAAIEIHRTKAGIGSAEEIGQAFAEGVGLSNWRFTTHRGTASDAPPNEGRLALTSECSDVCGTSPWAHMAKP